MSDFALIQESPFPLNLSASPISNEAETLHLTQYQMVGAVGLEPTIQKAGDFKSPAYASSATPPYSYCAHTSFLLPFNYSTRSTVST